MLSVSQVRLPKLRALDIRPYRHQGQPHILLRDPTQISDQTLLVPQPLAAVLNFCDGKHDARAMRLAFERQYGMVLPASSVEQLLTALDEALMLDNEQFALAQKRTLERYRQAAFRSPALAGASYPADVGKLRQLLNNYLAAVDDDEPLLAGSAQAWPGASGLLSPHIDYMRGGNVYAHVWKRAAAAVQAADLVVMIGTDHYGSDPFTLTRQHYATPYGCLPTAQPVVDALAEAIGEEAAFAGELRHRGEHSLELVAVWLHHMRNGQPCEFVPILSGGFHRFIQNGAAPAEDPLLNRVLDALRTTTANRQVVVIASGDLAHVGPAFGGRALDDAARNRLRADDDDLIEQMCGGQTENFFTSIRRVRDQNNVCGVAPIYLTMRLLDATAGQCVGYATCPADDADTSAVTICGVLFGG